MMVMVINIEYDQYYNIPDQICNLIRYVTPIKNHDQICEDIHGHEYDDDYILDQICDSD